MSVRSEMNALYESASTELVSTHYYLSWAKENPNSGLYKRLKCDDDASAADLWRHQELRVLIAVYIKDDSGARKTISLTTDRTNPGGGYRNVEDVAKDRDLYQIALADALHELDRVKAKYENVKGLEKVWVEVEKVRLRTEIGRAEASPAQSRAEPSTAWHSTAPLSKAG